MVETARWKLIFRVTAEVPRTWRLSLPLQAMAPQHPGFIMAPPRQTTQHQLVETLRTQLQTDVLEEKLLARLWWYIIRYLLDKLSFQSTWMRQLRCSRLGSITGKESSNPSIRI
jgi:hypothetical protein